MMQKLHISKNDRSDFEPLRIRHFDSIFLNVYHGGHESISAKLTLSIVL